MIHTIKKQFSFIWKRAGRKYIYVMWSWRMFYACKIGVSDTPKLRRDRVNKSVSEKKGHDVKLLYVYIPLIMWAYRTETVLHNSIMFRHFGYKGVINSDGGTEWFWCINPVSTLFFLIGCTYYDLPMYQWSVVFLLPCLPLDAILITFLFVLLQWALIACAAWLAWMGLTIIF